MEYEFNSQKNCRQLKTEKMSIKTLQDFNAGDAVAVLMLESAVRRLSIYGKFTDCKSNIFRLC